MAIILLLSLIMHSTPYSINCYSNNLSWMREGAYAQYSTDYGLAVYTYDSSLNLTNCYLATQDLALTQNIHIDPDAGEEFLYKWEVTSIVGTNITLRIDVNITGWQQSSFEILIDSSTRQTYDWNTFIGYSCLWLSKPYDALFESIVASCPPWSASSEMTLGHEVAPTPQGYQNVIDIRVTEDNFQTPYNGSRSEYRLHLFFDEDSGVLIASFLRLILPFPADYRFLVIRGMVWLEATNIDLGPDILLPNFGSAFVPAIILGVMVIAIIVLSVVIFYQRRKGRKRRIRIKKRKEN